MGIFDLLSGRKRLPLVIQVSAAAMKPQIAAARTFYSSAPAYEARLASGSTAAFLHGFVLFFAAKHGLRGSEYTWAATVQTFDLVFGPALSHSILMALMHSLRDGTAAFWIEEGANAAKDFDREGLALLKAFLEGGTH